MTTPARPTSLQATIDHLILQLVQLRSERILSQTNRIDDEDPEDLRLLAKLTQDFARAVDPLFHEVAYQGGLGSRSGASEYANIVTDAISGNLDFELTDRADTYESVQAEDRKPFDPQRAWGTLNKPQQGIS